MKDYRGQEFHSTEMYNLINALIERKANFKVVENWDTPQVIFFDEDGMQIGDAICHSGSYGHEQGLLEIMGLDVTEDEYGDTVLGHLTADEVLQHLDNAMTKAIK